MDTTLRKVGGSIMLIVPPALLDMLKLRPGAKVGVAVHKGRLVVSRGHGRAIRSTSCWPNATGRAAVPSKNRNGWVTSQPAESSSDEARRDLAYQSRSHVRTRAERARRSACAQVPWRVAIRRGRESGAGGAEAEHRAG